MSAGTWQVDGTTIYELDEGGVNLWRAQVETARAVTCEEAASIARFMRAAPEMLAVLEEIREVWNPANCETPHCVVCHHTQALVRRVDAVIAGVKQC